METGKEWRLPAEWEPQWGVQLTWPHEETDWQPYIQEITTTYIHMARAITEYETLLVVAPNTNKVRQLLEEAGINMSRVVFHTCPTNDTWARDHGFITMKRREERGEWREESGEWRVESLLPRQSPDCLEESGERRVERGMLLDFCFNGWGEKFEADKDNAINKNLFEKVFSLHPPLSSLLQYESHLDFILEGGSIESDGQGTILTTTSCLLAPHRNQPLNQQQIEEELKRRLHATHVLWVDYGHLEGDDTDGHIDTLVRMAPNDTLLYIGCDDTADPHYEDLKKMEQQLQTFRTVKGEPYRLLRLPMPEPIFEESGEWRAESGERLPATYANFLIINGAVLVPTYNQPTNDRKAIRIIQQAYPDRKMIPIDSRTIIRQHGSIHCCTMQFPLLLAKEEGGGWREKGEMIMR